MGRTLTDHGRPSRGCKTGPGCPRKARSAANGDCLQGVSRPIAISSVAEGYRRCTHHESGFLVTQYARLLNTYNNKLHLGL